MRRLVILSLCTIYISSTNSATRIRWADETGAHLISRYTVYRKGSEYDDFLLDSELPTYNYPEAVLPLPQYLHPKALHFLLEHSRALSSTWVLQNNLRLEKSNEKKTVENIKELIKKVYEVLETFSSLDANFALVDPENIQAFVKTTAREFSREILQLSTFIKKQIDEQPSNSDVAELSEIHIFSKAVEQLLENTSHYFRTIVPELIRQRKTNRTKRRPLERPLDDRVDKAELKRLPLRPFEENRLEGTNGYGGGGYGGSK